MSYIVQRGASKTMNKVLLILGAVLLILLVLYTGLSSFRAWRAEYRENITFREIAKNNAIELQKREDLLASARERERGRLAREQARRVSAANLAPSGDGCEIPQELLDILASLPDA